MLSLAKAAISPEFPAEICLVASDMPNAAGLTKASELGLRSVAIDRSAFDKRSHFEQELNARISDSEAELICLAGFMRLLSKQFVAGWQDKILNIHPSLLPAFKGLNTHQRAIESGVRITGCTVHIVRPAMDDGPIIGQTAVPIMPQDTPDSLADRVLQAEHRLYPYALEKMASGQVTVLGEKCHIENASWNKDSFANPCY